MKKFLALAVCSVFLLSATITYAADAKCINKIPERYALILISDAEPDQPLDKEKILEFVKAEFAKLDVAQLQYALYDKGKKTGDGVRAYGEFRKDTDLNIVEFDEPTGDNAQRFGKVTENLLGYQISPKELYDAYVDNEVVADDDFKSKPVILQVKVPQVSKDAFDKPYIKVPVDKHGFSGLHIYIDKSDPFLRKIKKGSQIIVRGYPKGLVMQDVMLDGIIVIAEGLVFVDGKAVPMEEVNKK